ncbi:FAD-binding protein [Nocardioides convexus]|uniref:FAD-binding protein n=1 Tax=Nocardioides convexus TaxID=2712224 RepID=UPI00241865FA|nr:FAD-binding protein [Nocardioides convexus]
MSAYDVIVVGSGGGALTGAALAARAGLRTLVLERTPLIGGTSAYSGGACWLPGSAVQQRAGLPDSTEGARAYLAAVLDAPDTARVEALLTQAPRLVATLEADEPDGLRVDPLLGVLRRARPGPDGPLHPARHHPPGRARSSRRGPAPPAGRARPGRPTRPVHTLRRPGADRPAGRDGAARRR